MSSGDKTQPSYNDKRNVVKKAHLIEPIIRHRIQDSIFYKQHLFLTNELTILPVIVSNVHSIFGTDATGRPSLFLCCLLRLLEIEPLKPVISVYLNQLGYNEFKYLTALMLIYVRLVYSSEEVYVIFDEYLSDYRKLRVKLKSPTFTDSMIPIHYALTYVDVWIDDLLTKERVVDIILPRLVARQILVDRGVIAPRKYLVDSDEDEGASNDKGSDSYESDSD